VGADNVLGARMAALHLIETGHRKIGIIAGFQRLSSMQERLHGFKQALAQNELSLPAEWMVTCPLSIDDGRAAAHQILAQPDRPSAVFVSNNLLMLGALEAVKELGLRCPEEISLLGFDDHPWASVCAPPLSVVRQPAREIGRSAAEVLCALIGGVPVEQQVAQLPCDLILRKSCCLSHS